MIEIRNRQFIIDGTARIVMAGEIHYFRLSRDDWQDRIDKLMAAGCNAVASYVPWLCHEPLEGQVDLDGHTRPELDLAAFIDLCADNGLWFFVRPGPFIMAEMKNEGLPYWIYEKHPGIVSVGWNGKAATTRSVDYLAPAFLAEARKWYASVMVPIVPRLQPNGGNIIAIQLDNEIGMLSWVSNCPELTDDSVAGFVTWSKQRYSADELRARYPFDPNDAAQWLDGVRAPREDFAAGLMQDLGHYLRYRYARYAELLAGYAAECGAGGVPYVINVHGSSSLRGITFPVGISQLQQAYADRPGFISGTDLYLGNLTPDNYQDLYVCNAFLAASQSPDQPLTALEFECGDGNYGNNFGNRYDPSAADFKTRMCIAQGNRLINYYLFTGGRNYRLDPAPDDGDGRIAMTGERHGIAAPVNPEGCLNYTYPRMARVIRTVAAVADKLAVMDEEHDELALGFIPDYYMTECRYRESAAMKQIAENLEANRGYGAWEIMVRALLLEGFRFGAQDLQNRELSVDRVPALALASARYMAEAVQRKLVAWLRAGGRLLLYGEVPLFDMDGKPCTVLCEALGVRCSGTRQASESYFLALRGADWAAPLPEVRTHFAQVFEAGTAEPLLRVCDSGEVCGFDARTGAGRAIVIAAAYPCELALFGKALELLGVVAGLRHDCPDRGIFLTSSGNAQGERFLHLLNLEGYDKDCGLSLNGRKLLRGRRLVLRAKEGLMLPLDVMFGDTRIFYSTAEIRRITPRSFEFRLTQPQDAIELVTERTLLPGADYEIRLSAGRTRIVSLKDARIDDRLLVRFA